MLQKVALNLALLGVNIFARNIVDVLHVPAQSPRSWYHIMVTIFTVQLTVLKASMSYSHEVVQTQAGLDDGPDGGWGMHHGCQQYLEPVGQYAESIFDDSAGA